MIRNFKKLLFIIVGCYGLAYFLLSEQTANFFLAVFVILYITFYFAKFIFANLLYNYSSRFVEKEFVKNPYTIVNENCIVAYTPNEKLVVSDNLTSDQRREKRVFTIYKNRGANIAKLWSDICKIFDRYTYFDALAAFVSKQTPIKIKLISTRVEKDEEKKSENDRQINTIKEQVVNNEQEQPIKSNANIDIKQGASKPRNTNTECINMDEISPDSYAVDSSQNGDIEDKYFVDFNNIRRVDGLDN